MKIRKFYYLLTLIFIIILLIGEIYGPLYMMHTDKSAIRYSKEEVFDKIVQYNNIGNPIGSISLENEIPIIYTNSVSVIVEIEADKEIQIPKELIDKITEKNVTALKNNISIQKIRLKFNIIKKGLFKWVFNTKIV